MNPRPVDLALYRAATQAEERFSRELARVYGKRAGDMRYRPSTWRDAALRAAADASQAANEAWLASMRGARATNPRPARYRDPKYMALRMKRRRESRWRIVARTANGMLLNFTGERLAAAGKPVIFPSRQLAHKFLRYLRRSFPAKLKRVRMLVMPA